MKQSSSAKKWRTRSKSASVTSAILSPVFRRPSAGRAARTSVPEFSDCTPFAMEPSDNNSDKLDPQKTFSCSLRWGGSCWLHDSRRETFWRTLFPLSLPFPCILLCSLYFPSVVPDFRTFSKLRMMLFSRASTFSKDSVLETVLIISALHQILTQRALTYRTDGTVLPVAKIRKRIRTNERLEMLAIFAKFDSTELGWDGARYLHSISATLDRNTRGKEKIKTVIIGANSDPTGLPICHMEEPFPQRAQIRDG